MQLQYYSDRSKVFLDTLETLHEEKKRRIADGIVDNFRRWKQQREGIERQWRDVDNLMNQYDPNRTPKDKMQQGYEEISAGQDGTQVGLSFIYNHREALVSQFHSKMFANDYDFFSILPLDANEEEKAQALEKYLQSLYQQMNLDTDMIPLVRDCVQYGTGIASFEIRQVTRKRRKKVYMKNEMGQILGHTWYQTEEVVYNGPKLTPLNLYDVVLDPTNYDVQAATLIMQKHATPHDMLANANYATLKWEDLRFDDSSAATTGEDYSKQQKEVAQGNEYQTLDTIYKGKVKVYEAWGDFVDDERMYQNYVAEVALLPNGQQRLIRFEPNPYDIPHKPFVICRFSTETSRLYGYTPLMQVVQHHKAANTIINQMKDANAMHNDRPVLAQQSLFGSKNKSEDTKPMPLGRNLIWYVRDINGVKRMPDDSYSGLQGSIELLNYLEGQMQKATGDNEVMSGGDIQEYTKTGYASMVQEGGAARFNLYAKTIERECVIPILKMTIQFLQQESDSLQPQQFNTGGGDSLEFRPELLFMKVDFILRAASYNATKQTEQNNMLNFFQMVLGNEMTAQFFNIPKVLKLIGQRIGIRGIENTFVPDALQMANVPNQQPGFWQRLGSFFSGGQQTSEQPTPGQSIGNSVTAPFTQATNPAGLSGFAGFGNAQETGRAA